MSPLELFLQQLTNGIALGGIYALIALGYTMVYGIIELINFAHGDVFMLGSFVAIAVLSVFGLGHPATGASLILVLLYLFLATCVLSGLIGVVIERVAYRPLRNAPRLAPLISAIGVSFILQNIVFLWRGPSPVSFPDVMPEAVITVGNVIIRGKQIFILFSSLIMMASLQLFVQRTRMGKAMRATAQDPSAAALMGINVNYTIALTFFIGSALAGAAGIIYGLYYTSVVFNIGYIAGLKAFTAAVLGGIGNLGGAMLGGFLIGIIEAFSAQYSSQAWADSIVFAVLILVLIFRPTGLLGQQLAERA